MVIRVDNGTLHATIGDRNSVLHPIRGDTFYARWFATGGPSPVVFGTDSLTWDGRAFAKPSSQEKKGLK
ncbi:MAG: hypothetical protein ACXW19_12465, partial [Thermoanaerobaculia bacterium]